jgi:hypothetical protein
LWPIRFYNNTRNRMKPAFTAILLLRFAASEFAQQQPTDQQIAAIVVQASRDAYYRTGHPCACPEDLARNGSRCGKRSAYSLPGGAEPYWGYGKLGDV